MTSRSHPPFKHMGNFKAVAMDYAFYLSLENVGRLYCLTDRQVYILMVQLEYVGWLTRWYNTEDITQTTVGYIQSDLIEALMSCVDVSILVDQANENLITAVTNRAIQSQTLRDIYADEYTGDPTSINPSAPTTTWSYDATEDGEAALCAALMGFVYQFARSQADSVRAGQIGGLAAISLIALLLIPGLNIFFVVGAAIAVLAGLGTVGVTTEIAIQALTDTEALDAVVCCMKDNLKDAAVSQATWDASLGGCGFEGGSHAQIVADFLGATLASNYLTFLDFMGTGYDAVTTLVPVPECPCAAPPGICEGGESVDFRVSEASWNIWLSRGLYFSGEGYGLNPAVSGNRVSIWRSMAPEVTRMRFNVSHECSEIRLYIYNAGLESLIGATTSSVLNGDGTRTYTMSSIGGNSFDYLIDIGGASALDADFRLHWVCWNYDE